MTSKRPVSMETIMGLLMLFPAVAWAAEAASDDTGFMSSIAEFFEAGGPFIYVNCITLCWGIAIIIERFLFSSSSCLPMPMSIRGSW